MKEFEISNVEVYDLEKSVIASRNAMRLELPDYTNEEFEDSLERAKKLVKESKEHKTVHCFDNFLTGIRVSFDIVYPQYWTPEAQRYHFLDIVTSSSKMHRLSFMRAEDCCNKWVSNDAINNLQRFIDEYNNLVNGREHFMKRLGQEWYAQLIEENFMKMVANCPMGLMLFERLSTNYKQLQTIYFQRRNHKLPEWRKFCRWIETLPYAKQLILGEE